MEETAPPTQLVTTRSVFRGAANVSGKGIPRIVDLPPRLRLKFSARTGRSTTCQSPAFAFSCIGGSVDMMVKVHLEE